MACGRVWANATGVMLVAAVDRMWRVSWSSPSPGVPFAPADMTKTLSPSGENGIEKLVRPGVVSRSATGNAPTAPKAVV